MVTIDPELEQAIKALTLKFTENPQPELLLRIPNRDHEVDYNVSVSTEEFTSLCPLNLGQPDYATIEIRYCPKGWTVELKSLKMYLASFRQVPIFHEQVPAAILRALVDLLQPECLSVFGDFTVRGGLSTKVYAVYPPEEETYLQEDTFLPGDGE